MNPSKEIKNEIEASVRNSIRTHTARNFNEERMTGHTCACEHGCVGVYKRMYVLSCVGVCGCVRLCVASIKRVIEE